MDNQSDLSLYIGQLMSRLLDVEFFLNKIPSHQMDAEDEIERSALLSWCNTHQKTVALLTQVIRNGGANTSVGSFTGANAFIAIEKFLDDLENQFPDILTVKREVEIAP